MPDTELIDKVIHADIELVSEIEFASRYTQGKIIAITGSNGKTTTASLCYHILKRNGFDVTLAGNIGVSFARCLAQNDSDYWVLELSSFQLDHIIHFQPDIAMVLNISSDHLDRYNGSLDNYIRAKMRITENQTSEHSFIY